MFLIADGGASKTDWRLVEGDRVLEAQTGGFNPVYEASGTLETEVARLPELFNRNFSDGLRGIFYYGSGCGEKVGKETVGSVLGANFPAATIEVEHDLLAAARACAGRKPGIVCILGTGSNSCLYDGKKIADQLDNLGYLIGDEGSGMHLGKELLRAYYYRDMEPSLRTELEAHL
ncbi:MAG: hypothetical protein R3350_03295, partial [Saprospiraceae bacterium]|nr:hypothetical protein [Saprospiraceae bacterium]